MAEEVHAVVVDFGSGMVKAGFAGDEAPRSVFPTIIGTHRLPVAMHYSLTGTADRLLLGDEARAQRGILNIKYPLERNTVVDPAGAEALWHHTFYNELRVDPHDRPVLATESPLNPKRNSEWLAEILFEKFEVPAMYVQLQPVLSLMASGRHCACVVDVGDTVTTVMPIEGVFAMPRALRRVDVGGRDLTEYLERLLIARGSFVSTTTAERDVVREIKEKLCYVAKNAVREAEVSSSLIARQFELPDGTMVTLGQERFLCPEALFSPDVLGVDAPGIAELVFESIMHAEMDYRKDFFGNILLSGGCTMFEGFASRLEAEVAALAPQTLRVKVIAPPERKYSVWVGGSTLATLSSFQQIWYSNAMYDERGPSIVHRDRVL